MSVKTKRDKQFVDSIQQKTRAKHMYYNRYLMIRYFLAIFMFANFYWFVCTTNTMKIIPGVLFILGAISCIEVAKVYGKKQDEMKWTKRFYQLQMIVNVVCLVLIWTPLFYLLLPFLVDVVITRIVAAGIYLIGGMMAFACVYRLKQIDQNSDKKYLYIKQYEKTANMNI